MVIKATIGPDGKVTDAEIVTSIPLLDEPALNAVRQWEYAPTLIKGVPTSVIMTVTVHFSLQESSAPPGSRTGPLVLDRDGADWTIGGTPLLDDNLRFWLHDVMRTEPDKELYVHASGTGTWGELVNVLSSATAAGVEKLYVFVGNLDPKQGVRVWLDPVLQKMPGVDLPVSDVAAQERAGIPVTIPRTGATASAKASMQRAKAGASVRLRVDRSRRVSDAWDVPEARLRTPGGGGSALRSSCRLGPSRRRTRPSLRSSSVNGKPWRHSTNRVPTPWRSSRNSSLAIANVFDAQFKLALAYEARATTPGASPEARRRDWEEPFAITRSPRNGTRTKTLDS